MSRIILTSWVALCTAGVLAVLGEVRADPAPAGPDRPLVVTFVSPALRQNALADLSDPGTEGRITVRFSAYVNPADILDEQNLVNGLSANCDLHTHTLARVAGAAFVRHNELSFDPFSIHQPVLSLGRYTLTLKSSIRSVYGRRLNGGRSDFTTSFSVGDDVYPPVLRQISPTAGETGIGAHVPVVVTFDTPMDRVSAARAIRLEDRSTDPPTPIRARIRLARRGLDVIVSPRAPSGWRAYTDVTVVIAGRGTATNPSVVVLKDTNGNEFTRDAGVQWTADADEPTLFHSLNGDFDDVSGEFAMTFRTRARAR